MFHRPLEVGVPIIGHVRKCLVGKLFQTTMALFVVLLDFDGSLRPPRDHGFPTIPAKIATGSASISIGRGTDPSSQVWPVAVGSGWFPSERDMTSTHAEYLALLLGLEYLNNLSNLDGLYSRHFNENHKDNGHECCSLLVIKGDCKVVIDQLNGKSIPRKVQILHGRVMDLLHQLQKKFGTIEAKHVPRTENTLCDGLCITLMNIIEWQAIQTFARDLDGVATRYGFTNSTTTSSTTKTSIPTTTIPSEQLSPSWLLARHFQSESTCHIKYSSRRPLYDAIAWLSKTVDDPSTLVEVGKRQAAESTLVNDKRLLATGIGNQIEGLASQNSIKKSLFLKRKHRVLLSSFEDNEFVQRFDIDQFLLLVSQDAPLEWNHGSGQKWKDLVERMHKVAMATDWKEGSQLWVSTDT